MENYDRVVYSLMIMGIAVMVFVCRWETSEDLDAIKTLIENQNDRIERMEIPHTVQLES